MLVHNRMLKMHSVERFVRSTLCILLSILLGIAITVSYLLSNTAYAQDRTTKVKAVFIFKFANYISWPETPPVTNICILGNYENYSLLEKLNDLRAGKTALKKITSDKELDGCNILYLANKTPLPSTATSKPILTISEEKDFAKTSGIIEIEDTVERINLKINITNLENAKLKASARLLDLAEVIR